jgi:hypothetical protein
MKTMTDFSVKINDGSSANNDNSIAKNNKSNMLLLPKILKKSCFKIKLPKSKNVL